MVYVVMHAFYSDWELFGYFTTKEEAEKYVVAHSKDEDLIIIDLECLDNTIDLSSIVVRYEKIIRFKKVEDSWACISYDDDDIDVKLYQSDFPRSNYIERGYRWGHYDDDGFINVWVNTTKNDLDLQKKIAQDLFYQFLDFCNNKITDKKIKEYNKILSKEEDERTEAQKQEELKQKELKELARLKAKYE